MSRSTTASSVALGVDATGESTAAPVRVLPVRGELAAVLPWGGLRRGSTVSVRGSTSLLLALLSEATAEGSWAAIVGLPGCGALAAAETGVAVRRLALVPSPGRDRTEVDRVVAALLDGFDVVVVATPVTASSARRLTNRARQRRSVLVPFDVEWPGVDLELTAEPGPWSGLGEGFGVLRARELTVVVAGRGAATRPKRTTFPLPAAEPLFRPATPDAEPSPLRPLAEPGITAAEPLVRPEPLVLPEVPGRPEPLVRPEVPGRPEPLGWSEVLVRPESLVLPEVPGTEARSALRSAGTGAAAEVGLPADAAPVVPIRRLALVLDVSELFPPLELAEAG
ncbi:hypothetical protein [Actinosynnema sp. NPDC020468]|uniref:hypothetical protein n=1 Tax=Actinosynnema sp. NPDC020468 TaxID=3154488 RepID=UPI0033D3DC4E